MSFNKNFKEYFDFSKSERSGIIVLSTIILLLILFLNFRQYLFSSENYDFKIFENEINKFENNVEKPINEIAFDTAFYFNPNEVSSEEMRLLGFSEKNINTIEKIRNKSFVFRKKEDLKNIYGFDSLLYNKLESFIVFDDETENNVNAIPSERESAKENKHIEYHQFNPNYLTENECLSLGLTAYQSKMILNYIQKGGRFSKKEDFKKIYSINDSLYKMLEPYIIIEKDEPENAEAKIHLIDLNSADSISLVKLKGIGPSYAKGILKYRKMLGGYQSVEQLQEVYGINAETYNNIEKYFSVDISRIKKININKASFKEILSHPYFDKQLTKSITEVRDFNGSFSHVDELLKFKLVTEEIFNKIKNYITVSD